MCVSEVVYDVKSAGSLATIRPEASLGPGTGAAEAVGATKVELGKRVGYGLPADAQYARCSRFVPVGFAHFCLDDLGVDRIVERSGGNF